MSATISQSEWQAMKDRTDEVAPKVLPPNWREEYVPPSAPCYGVRAYSSQGGLHVLLSCGPFEDGRWWLHVSCTAPRRVPCYGELCEVKDLFVGRERQALQVFPKRSEHVNIHAFCLHLWCCLDGDGLPAFGAGGSI